MVDPVFPGWGEGVVVPIQKVGAQTYYLAKQFSKTMWKWMKLDQERGASIATPWIRHCHLLIFDLPLRPTSVNIPWNKALVCVKIARPSSWSMYGPVYYEYWLRCLPASPRSRRNGNLLPCDAPLSFLIPSLSRLSGWTVKTAQFHT